MEIQLPVYLDNNASTRVDPQVLDWMLPYFTHQYGNAASRTHSFGWTAEEAVRIARVQVADLIGATDTEIVFTSGATEAINLAMKGVFELHGFAGKHLITCVTEHKAVLDTAKKLEKQGAQVTYLPVDTLGRIDTATLEAAITPQPVMIAVMFANNETGVIQPVQEIGAIAKQRNVLFFSDATQAVGKVKIDVQQQQVDLLCMSAHKFYGPKGIGALYVRRKNPRVRLVQQIDGGGHEKAMRSGTLNVPGIVGLGKAAAIAATQMEADQLRVAELRNTLENALVRELGAIVNGSLQHRIPNTTNLSFAGVDGGKLLTDINQTIAVSSGSACTSANPEPSHVLKAIEVTDELAKSSVRFGLGRFTTAAEIEYVIERITAIVRHLRSVA